jgi:NAD(P)-dependent dehydrogenase (short-subunit alcohol dehydrogenase family)
MKQELANRFDLKGKNVVITGAGGLLGPQWAEAVIECGGTPIITDIDYSAARTTAQNLIAKYSVNVPFSLLDVTDPEDVEQFFKDLNSVASIDVLINNAAKDPKVKKGDSGLQLDTRFETMTFGYFQEGIDAIVNGTFLCSQAAVKYMLENGTKGVIVNIASDLSVIAPDQRIYRKEGLPWEQQPVKPITYSAAKYAVVGMTKYLATYLAEKGIRVNCLSPTGVLNNHPEEFVQKLSGIIPMGRMAQIDEYKAAMAFLCSDASSYMTGHNLVIDGGKSVW